MPCPYYKYGMCNSPKLDQPTDEFVNPVRCNGGPEIYVTCAMYIPPEESRSLNTLEKNDQGTSKNTGNITEPRDNRGIYPLINSLPMPIHSECQYYRLEKRSSGIIVARCEILKRYLTKYEAKLCEHYWRDCPFRQ